MEAKRSEHLARGQIGGGRKIGALCQGPERSEHLGRGQIGGDISPGGRMIRALCQRADRWG